MAKDLIDEVVKRWHPAYTAAQQAPPAPPVPPVPPAPAMMGPGTLTGLNIKLEKPEQYDGDAQKLANWTLNVQ